MRPNHFLTLCCAAALLAGCSEKDKTEPPKAAQLAPAPVYFKVDPETASTVTGQILYKGKRPAPKVIDMSEEPACVEAHKGKAYNESLVVNKKGDLANAFIYIKTGLEGKTFQVSADPVTIDQNGCWFHPRVLGIQTGQTLKIVNSDP
ncbi:MAG: hypothetical protein QOH35_3259, partial [Acidobacteriaceae bacterium]|nr:hypothetical protein [Acidobacteriaceae bacterium]